MTVVNTQEALRRTRESARLERYEPGGSISATNVQDAIEQASTQPPAVIGTPVTVIMSPYVPLPTDTFLLVDTSGGPITINMPAASTRNGVPLTVKDDSGNASTNNITINLNGAETVDGLAPWLVNADFGAVRLVPKAGSGYKVDA